jgi:hypothetical protein
MDCYITCDWNLRFPSRIDTRRKEQWGPRPKMGVSRRASASRGDTNEAESGETWNWQDIGKPHCRWRGVRGWRPRVIEWWPGRTATRRAVRHARQRRHLRVAAAGVLDGVGRRYIRVVLWVGGRRRLGGGRRSMNYSVRSNVPQRSEWDLELF